MARHRGWEKLVYSALMKCDCSIPDDLCSIQKCFLIKLQYHLHTHILFFPYRFYNSSDRGRKSAPNTMPETILCVNLSAPAIGLFVLLRYICGFGRCWQHVRRIEGAGGAAYCGFVCHSFILTLPAWVVYPQVILKTLFSHIIAIFTCIVNLEAAFNMLNFLS